MGQQLNRPVLTTDRAWEGLGLRVEIRLVRSCTIPQLDA